MYWIDQDTVVNVTELTTSIQFALTRGVNKIIQDRQKEQNKVKKDL